MEVISQEIETISQEEETSWYKDAIIYEVHVRSFYDSNADGVGDFHGLINKLDYLQFLGVTLIWLLPFYPSPLKDDGYDISDYFDVNSIYGNIHDFKQFLKEAHRRNIKVMIELIINHTSNEHAWFQRSRHAKPNSRWRDFYVWSDTPEKYSEARIIFKDFESSNWSFDPVANAYYWHRFYSHQPDLNYESKDVQREVLRVIDFWFKLGVDALRLDAIPYLFEREGTSCENLPETYQYLRTLRAYIDKHYKNRFILAEANQWPEDAVAYFGNGDLCQMAFHFPMMPRMYTAIEMEDRFPLVDILEQTPQIPENCQWATFLRNHDELTLEMVTDEERDYMYRIFADDPQMRINLGIRRRLVTLMKSDRRKIELMYALLFTLPGTPVIYYGDEIGMGDNIYLGDRNSVRTPMQWNEGLNAGFSKANPQQLYLPLVIDPEYNYQYVNVELQLHNDQSLLWWAKRFISMRKRYKSFGRGNIEFLLPENHKILAFLRTYQNETMLIIANLSRFSQYVELDLSKYNGFKLIELLGDTEFPNIKENCAYGFSMQPYSFYVFSLEGKTSEEAIIEKYEIPTIKIDRKWNELITKNRIQEFELLLKNYLPFCKWFASKSDKIYSATIKETILLDEKLDLYLLFITVAFREKKETYILLVSQIEEKDYTSLEDYCIATLKTKTNQTFYLIEGPVTESVGKIILRIMGKKKLFRGYNSNLISTPTKIAQQIMPKEENLSLKVMNGEQTNTSVIFSDSGIFKLFRRVEVGINPDVEVCTFLMEHTNFKNSPKIASQLTYTNAKKSMTVGLFEEYIINQNTAWKYTLAVLKIFFESALASQLLEEEIRCPPSIFNELQNSVSEEAHHLMGLYLNSVKILALRTSQMHSALASSKDIGDFKPENYTLFDQRALHQTIQSLCRKTFNILKKKSKDFPKHIREEVNLTIDFEKEFLNLTSPLLSKKLNGQKIRCHGDYHLGQVLYTGNDFYIIDFEGEPDRPLSERRIKRSPLKDVAGMLRSFHYAVNTVMFDVIKENGEEKINIISKWGLYWYRWCTQAFLKEYLDNIRFGLLPQSTETIELLRLYMLEKAIYEINYEINHRPLWLMIPCAGLLELIAK